jgi:peptidoglycan/LPS O-acetylase OafA/YrhL
VVVPERWTVDAKAASGRLRFLDGLRAVAALAVLFHHLYYSSEFDKVFSAALPVWFAAFAEYCARGVQVFFVLSGFVIAYSLRDLRVDRRTAVSFALRRQIRLDPPYWICLAVAVIDWAVVARVHPDLSPAPTIGAFLLNFFYLPAVTHVPIYLTVAWTLCLEVQFYLVFILILWAAQARSPRATPVMVIFLLGLGSLAFRSRLTNDDYPWFVGSFYLFAAGVLVCWVALRRAPVWMLGVYVLAMLAVGVAGQQQTIVAGFTVAVLIHLAATGGHLDDWLTGRFFAYVGRIAHNLNLGHQPRLTRV